MLNWNRSKLGQTWRKPAVNNGHHWKYLLWIWFWSKLKTDNWLHSDNVGPKRWMQTFIKHQGWSSFFSEFKWEKAGEWTPSQDIWSLQLWTVWQIIVIQCKIYIIPRISQYRSQILLALTPSEANGYWEGWQQWKSGGGAGRNQLHWTQN